MKYFLNPIVMSDAEKVQIFFMKAAIVLPIFLILLGITIHVAKKERNIKKLIPLIIGDFLIIAFVIVIMAILD